MTIPQRLRAPGTWSWLAAAALVAAAASFLHPAGNGEQSTVHQVGLVKSIRLADRGGRQNVAALSSLAAAPGRSPADSSRNQLARTATLRLLVPDVERAIGALRVLARRSGGEVSSLDDERPALASDARSSADVSLAVPADAMDDALTRIAALGGVRSRAERAQDVGTEVVDDAARLRNLRRTEADMLKIMDRSGKIDEVLNVENQLAAVREEIEKLAGELEALHRRVAYATIDVSLLSDAAQPAAAEPDVAVRLSDAWHAALLGAREFSIGVAARAFVGIAFAPYWLAATLAFLLVRRAISARPAGRSGG